jgi:hypothetical protein
MRRMALLIAPALLLAASPALANRGVRGHGPRVQSSGQVITRGGTSAAANLARARGHRVLTERQAEAGAHGPPGATAAQRGTSRGERDRILRQQLAQHRDMNGGLDRRSMIALFVGVPAITTWILALSQYGHSILEFFVR